MSYIAEFVVPADAYVLAETLNELPEVQIEIDRVVAHGHEALTPYFWVSGEGYERFGDVAADDPSVADLVRLDEFEEATLYRANWTGRIDSLSFAYTSLDVVILTATGTRQRWELRMRFADQNAISEFQRHAAEGDVSYRLDRLYSLSEPVATGGRYGLTPKQHEALLAALDEGYFEDPREATLEDVAALLDITPQALSKRLRRAEGTLLRNVLVVDEPHPEAGVE